MPGKEKVERKKSDGWVPVHLIIYFFQVSIVVRLYTLIIIRATSGLHTPIDVI